MPIPLTATLLAIEYLRYCVLMKMELLIHTVASAR
jgi:hypothetical protein